MIDDKHHSKYLQNAFNKYGEVSFEFHVLEFCSKEDLIKTEQKYIDFYSPDFNMNPIAGSNLGRKFSLETREKIRQANLGKKLTPELKAIAIKNLRPTPFGRKHTEATKIKMSEARKLNPPKGMLGKKHSKESVQKIIEAQSKNYKFINPQGEVIEIHNLAEFARDNGLSQSHLYAVYAGKRKSHKGWTKY